MTTHGSVPTLKTFAVADEIGCTHGAPDCACVHWVCPFCGEDGDAEGPLTPYFSVICAATGKVFLVKQADEE